MKTYDDLRAFWPGIPGHCEPRIPFAMGLTSLQLRPRDVGRFLAPTVPCRQPRLEILKAGSPHRRNQTHGKLSELSTLLCRTSQTQLLSTVDSFNRNSRSCG